MVRFDPDQSAHIFLFFINIVRQYAAAFDRDAEWPNRASSKRQRWRHDSSMADMWTRANHNRTFSLWLPVPARKRRNPLKILA
jgi:hypothetical protein